MVGLRKVRQVIKYFIPDWLLYRHIVPMYKSITRASEKQRHSLRFQINVTDHCNLNCKGCTAFSPLAKEKYIDAESYERDCKRLSELTGGKIELIDLLGGEPLLHPEINRIMEISRSNFEGDINVVTNGILLAKMPEAFWKSCKKNNVNIIISRYPIKLPMDKIDVLAEQYGVNIVNRGNATDVKIWNKVPYDLSGKQNITKNFRTCYGANFCTNLENGKLATCPIPFVIKQFNEYFCKDIPVSEDNCIDIYKVKNIDEIYAFLCKPAPICAYCNLKGIKYGIEWEVSKKELSEWV